jgi:hypothetical protein
MPPSYDNLIGNPFESKPDKPVTPNFGALGYKFLSQEDAERFSKLESANQPNKQSPLIRGPACNASLRAGRDIEGFNLESGMTAEQRAKSREAKELRETRNRLIKWAEEFKIGNEEWVDKNFTFLPDGSAICEGDLELSNRGIAYFPKGIKKVHGDLYLSHNQLTKIENLPAYVGGGLYLSNNQITKIENLPASVGGSLYLSGNPAKRMQAGVNVGGALYLSRDQTELMQDAQDKGYGVTIF